MILDGIRDKLMGVMVLGRAVRVMAMDRSGGSRTRVMIMNRGGDREARASILRGRDRRARMTILRGRDRRARETILGSRSRRARVTILGSRDNVRGVRIRRWNWRPDIASIEFIILRRDNNPRLKRHGDLDINEMVRGRER